MRGSKLRHRTHRTKTLEGCTIVMKMRSGRASSTPVIILTALNIIIMSAGSVWCRNLAFISPVSTSTLLYDARGGSLDSNESITIDDSLQSECLDIHVEAKSELIHNDTCTNYTQRIRNLTFAASNDYDGSKSDPDGIPTRFLEMKRKNRVEAKLAFRAHVQWRTEFQVDSLLARPHKLYDVCKAMLPHYFPGRDSHNNVIFVQRPALLDFDLMRKNNATMDDLLMHYVYVLEYCWNILDPGPPEKVMTNVLDMKGMSFRNINNQEYIAFGKRFVQMMSSNYPGRSYKTLIINAPSWFHILYKLFKPILRESTREKILIFKPGDEQNAALLFYLGNSIPNDLMPNGTANNLKRIEDSGNTSINFQNDAMCEPGPNSTIELEMRQFVSRYNVHCLFSLSPNTFPIQLNRVHPVYQPTEAA